MTFRRTPAGDHDEIRCSFCNKSKNDVRKLIAGPTVQICDECVQVCNDIIADDGRRSSQTTTAVEAPSKSDAAPATGRILTCALCGMPMPWEDALLIPERGVLCPGCIGEVEAAAAQKRESPQ